MELTMLEPTPTGLRAGYSCPCGCTPSVGYERDGPVVDEGCCCGNQFAVGPAASASLTPVGGYHLEAQPIMAPWGEALEAAWLIGPSVHGPTPDHDHHDHHDHHDDHDHAKRHAHELVATLDPVCGMTVDPETARAKGLHSSHEGRDYFFCGKGCKLDFEDDPRLYLDPAYVPSM